jgi:hemerythrin-like domain-containing protein
MSSDAIVILKDDHKQVRALFRKFEQAGDGAEATKARLVDQMLEALTKHTYIENEGMYPEVTKLVPDLESDILESLEEHHVADVLCTELAVMSPEARHFDAKVTVLIESVEHHIKEEEEEWFPKVREALSRKQLQEIGERLLELREKAPTRPESPKALKKAFKALIS